MKDFRVQLRLCDKFLVLAPRDTALTTSNPFFQAIELDALLLHGNEYSYVTRLAKAAGKAQTAQSFPAANLTLTAASMHGTFVPPWHIWNAPWF